MKHSRVYALLLFAANLAPVAGFKKLGSPKPEVCHPMNYDCPSHMACVPSDYGTLHCVCDRFLGFRGQECREHTRVSWTLLVFTIVVTLWAFWSLLSNITLAIELKEAGRLKANSIGRTLLFNSLSTLPVMALAIGFALTVLVVDPHMEFYQHGRQTCIAIIFLFYFLTTLSVSVVWIIDVQKMASVGLGIESIRLKKRQERVYLTAAYVISLSSAVLIVIFFAISSSAIQIVSFIGIVYNIFVAGSYYYAGRRVIQDLRVAEVSATMRQMDIAQIAQNIRNTSQTMTRLALGMSASFIGVGLTIPSSYPTIPQQNSLPRWLQGQLFYFMTQACALGVNQLIVEYMRYGTIKRHLKPQSTVASAVGWLLCRPSAKHLYGSSYSLRTVVPELHNAGGAGERNEAYLEEISSETEDSAYPSGTFSGPGSELPWGLEYVDADTCNSDGHTSLPLSDLEKTIRSQLYYNLYGLDSRNQGIVKLAVEQSECGDDIVRPQLPSVPSAGARQYLPFMLATLHTEGCGDDPDTFFEHASELRPRVRGKTVMNIGGGVVVNLAAAGNMTKEELEVPSKGSHAFVRCYGENHLRCTWHTFEFGSAGGHELLANRSTVLMEGEVEVDEKGFVTRWLHKSGVNTAPLLGLNMPPMWVVKLLGFPFSSTWLTVAAPEVNALAEHFKASLVFQSHLIRLDCSTQPSIPDAPTASRFASSCCAIISTIKALPSRVCVSTINSRRVPAQNSSHGSFASDISSISAGSVDPNDCRALPVGMWGREGIEACVVPRAAIHAEDTWIIKVDMWKTSLLQSAFVSMRDSLASFCLAKRSESRPVRLILDPEGLSGRGSLSGSGSAFSDGIDDARSPESSSTESGLRIHATVPPPLRNAAKKKKNTGPPPLLIIKMPNNKHASHTSSVPRPLSGVWGIEESEAEDDLDDDDDITSAMGTQEHAHEIQVHAADEIV